MTETVRLGIIGTGSISIRGLLPHLTMDDVQDRVNVTAVCDPVVERAEAAAAKFGVPHFYDSAQALLASGSVDAVSIASPIGLHFKQGMQCVDAGVHVHFNKTMTTTVNEADQLIAAAAAKDVKLVACPGEMLRPHHQRIKEMIDNGVLGILTWAVTGSAFGRYHENERVRGGDDPLTNVNPAWYFRKPGGGPLYDMTVYGLHAMTGILGPAKRGDRILRRAGERASLLWPDAAHGYGRQHTDGPRFWRQFLRVCIRRGCRQPSPYGPPLDLRHRRGHQQ